MLNLKVQESRIRRKAKRCGYQIHKSRKWKHVPNLDNFGEYMLINRDGNLPVLGHRYDATLGEIEVYLND